MRIDAYQAITQVYQPMKSAGAKSAKAASAYGRDEVQISSFGKDYQVAKQAVANASDVREDLVAAMKEKYSGDVKVDTGDFADALLAKFNQGI